MVAHREKDSELRRGVQHRPPEADDEQGLALPGAGGPAPAHRRTPRRERVDPRLKSWRVRSWKGAVWIAQRLLSATRRPQEDHADAAAQREPSRAPRARQRAVQSWNARRGAARIPGAG